MSSSPDSSRREFLSGQAARKEIREVGDQIADAVIESDSGTSEPTGGETVRLETRAMGCPWFVIMNPGPPRQVMVASDAFDVVRDVEQMLTIYREESDVSKLNCQAFQEECNVSPELFGFLELCREIFRNTTGAFDPAIGVLIQLWKSARTDGRIPTDEEITESLSRSGLNHVLLDDVKQTVRFERPLALDFASIGKGYGIDRAAEHLRNEEIDAFLVHGGQSSLYACGEHNSLPGWPIGLKNPLFTDRRYATILLRESGMSTSGSNIQYFRHAGKRYGHLLDPRTGRPAEGILSVTVVAPTSAEADALSTAFYAMGLDKGLKYCDDHPQIGAIFVPLPRQGRLLEPVVRNLSDDRVFFDQEQSSQVEFQPT